MGKATAIRDLFRAIGRAFRGPVRAPRPMPHPAPARPRPAPAPPPQRKPPTPQPRRPVPPPPDMWGDTETDPRPEQQPDPDTGPEGQTETQGGPKTGDEPECKTCPDCVARETGVLVPNQYGPVEEAAQRGYAYQHFVCPWHAHVPSKNLIQEWNFSGVDFDGLHPAECLLFEAKHGYDGFLVTDDWSAGGRPEPRRWAMSAFDRMINQAGNQHAVVAPHYPEVRLTWVFSSMTTKLYVFQRFLDRNWVPPIDAEVRPFTQDGDDE